MADIAATYGRFSAGLGVVGGVLVCVVFLVVGGLMLAMPTNAWDDPSSTMWPPHTIGWIMGGVGILVLVLSIGLYALVSSNPAFAAGYGTVALAGDTASAVGGALSRVFRGRP